MGENLYIENGVMSYIFKEVIFSKYRVDDLLEVIAGVNIG
jgi:hypothetical protein